MGPPIASEAYPEVQGVVAISARPASGYEQRCGKIFVSLLQSWVCVDPVRLEQRCGVIFVSLLQSWVCVDPARVAFVRQA